MQLGDRLLIVDDVSDNIQIAMNMLREQNYDFSFALNGKDALQLVQQTHFDLILLDIMMPGLDGFEVCKRFKSQPETEDIPVIFLTAKADVDSISTGFALGAVDYITKPFHAEELIARVSTHLDLYHAKQILQHHNLSLNAKIEKKEARLKQEIDQYQKEMIHVLTELMEATSDETGRHIRRVAEFSRLLAHYHPNMTEEDAEVIFYAAPMHDIGKIAVPHEIIQKPGSLDTQEICEMKLHTEKAHKFLGYSQRLIMKSAAIIAYQHHEKWNGTGYPQGLSGEEIHIYARIVAVADVFDALTHKRVYKEAWPLSEAVNYIKAGRNQDFDPDLVDIFLEHLDEFEAIIEN